MVQDICYSNGPPSHTTLPFEYRTPIMSGIQVSGIEMVNVFVTGSNRNKSLINKCFQFSLIFLDFGRDLLKIWAYFFGGGALIQGWWYVSVLSLLTGMCSLYRSRGTFMYQPLNSL